MYALPSWWEEPYSLLTLLQEEDEKKIAKRASEIIEKREIDPYYIEMYESGEISYEQLCDSAKQIAKKEIDDELTWGDYE